jgi:hypothetical protein
MKTAVMFYGLPRYVERTFPKIRDNIIIPNNADVFVHTWVDDTVINTPQQHYNDETLVSDVITHDIIHKIDKLYKPKSISYGCRPNLKKVAHPRINLNSKLHVSIYEQHISGYKVNNLRLEYQKEHNVKYDMILRCRFDNYSHTKWIANQYDVNKLYVPFRNDVESDNPVLDQMAWGNDENMTIYSDVAWNINQMVDMGVPLQSEFLLHFHLVRFDVPIQRENFIITYTRYSDEV